MKKLLIILTAVVAIAAVSCKRDKKELTQPPVTSTPQVAQKEFNCKALELPLTKRRPTNPGNGHGNGGNGGGGNGGGGNPPTGTQNVIMIDYDGGVITASSWNAYNNNNDIVYTPSGLSLADNKLVVQKIALALDSLNVTVTDRQSLFDSTPIANRQKLILTAYNFYSPTAGGVAFLSSFGTGEVTWVFTQSLNYNVANIYEASPHELGHTMGCYHQSVWHETCYFINAYRPGCTMGNPYGISATWVYGQTERACNYYQDDMQTMIATVGRKY